MQFFLVIFVVIVNLIIDRIMKIGIIRCQQTEDLCGGNACLFSAAKEKGAFAEIIELNDSKENSTVNKVVSFISCGGCPGKKTIPRAKMLIEKGAEVIALASCIGKGTPIGFPCPHFEQIKNSLRKQIKDIKLLEWTHN